MSRKKCCCKKKQQECCCCGSNYSGGGLLGGGDGLLGSGCTPIIFLLIACGSGLLNCNKSYLIILLFLLCGFNFLGGRQGASCC